MVVFASSEDTTITASADGALALRDNWYETVELSARWACAPAVIARVALHANLRAAPMDADFGYLSGLQFAHGSAVGYQDRAALLLFSLIVGQYGSSG